MAVLLSSGFHVSLSDKLAGLNLNEVGEPNEG